MNKYERYWDKVESVWIPNDKIDDGSYFKEMDKFGEMFFTKGYDKDIPVNKLVEKEGVSFMEYRVKEIKYLEKAGVLKIIKKECDEREDN